ncbi:thyroid hormone receptor beta-A [Magallana gigas]|uniref:thyroid hormone receptor beta-A n=1 Tax=Magallana gigas TaxID=29159 RepID=UPI0005C34FB0|eukprot:XP_011443300.1 PREDICTED: thyroid hormone receptor beta-A [Crassostrea gigas]
MDIRLGCDKNEFVDGMNRGYMPYFPPAMIQHSQTSSFVLPEYKQVLPQRSSQREESSNEDGTAHYSGLSAMSKPSPENSMPSPSSATSSSSPASSQASSDAGGSDGAGGNKRKGTPYIPSYMDLTNGPEPCVVCGDAATGYHYRCMTCEGCKGFFRRTIQKNLQYHCKWNKMCSIDKNSRNQCQECRFRKCLNVGMATDLVLNEKQRKAKRKLIEENREKRKQDNVKVKPKPTEACNHDSLTETDKTIITEVTSAYEQTAVKVPLKEPVSQEDLISSDPEAWQQLAEAMTPSIVKVVEFAKNVPGFIQLFVDDQILLLKSCCMEIMCLRAACRYDPEKETITMHNGVCLHKSQLKSEGLGLLVEPIFEFAVGLSKLKLDKTELALLAAVLLMQSDRSGLKEPEAVEKLQDSILGAFKRYIATKRPHQPVHWAKILMKVTDLRTISTRHAERVLCIRLDHQGDIPPQLLDLFNEGQTYYS